jgi:hypothetical protein
LDGIARLAGMPASRIAMTQDIPFPAAKPDGATRQAKR